jgi:tetratricopeptide (TPR) repeat protein
VEPQSDPRRKNPRIKAPKNLLVGWKSPGYREVSHAETIALGGLFLHTSKPPAPGSVIELVFDLATGEIRARAVVRHATPGKGMGIQFVQMGAEERATLNRFLAKYTAPQSGINMKPKSDAADSERGQHPVQDAFESELAQMLALAKKGTFYQLLGVTPDSPLEHIKQSFYARARQFHPDHHMERKELLGSLKELMAAITQAYKTLKDAEQRADYDRKLATSGAFMLGRSKTESQETIEECLNMAKQCLRCGNFIGSIPYLRKCVDMAPHEAKFRASLARSLGTVPQYRSEAIDHFQKAIELDPWTDSPYLQCAELYEQMQQLDLAAKLYSRLLAINPVHAKARARQAELISLSS